MKGQTKLRYGVYRLVNNGTETPDEYLYAAFQTAEHAVNYMARTAGLFIIRTQTGQAVHPRRDGHGNTILEILAANDRREAEAERQRSSSRNAL